MPNHVLNELVFRDLTPETKAALLADIVNGDGRVDFGILVPMPPNIWQGDVSPEHEAKFKNTGMSWARENWGTKWNAYDCRPVVSQGGTLTIAFETAWSPPYPWLAAIFNKHKVSFDHNWLDEGRLNSVHGRFNAPAMERFDGTPWKETEADREEYLRMYHLHFGDMPEEGEA